jgi:hypothetical protein
MEFLLFDIGATFVLLLGYFVTVVWHDVARSE